jgi:predicted SPOUT superfamily RNA methylase MTH1
MRTSVHQKEHHLKKEKTRSITYRLPEDLVRELETESMEKNTSQNVLVKQILEKHVQWDRYADKIGMIPVPKNILDELGKEMSGEDIDSIIKAILPMIKETVLFIKGKYDLKRCIETLEDYMKASGMRSDHRLEGNLHHFVIQHELGIKWSLLTEKLFKEIFHEFLPDQNVKCQTTEKTIIATIALGSDFSEHDY